MVIWEAFGAAILFSLIGEIADKTQLIILGFALDFKAPWKVFFGALAGHAGMDALTIILGTYIGFAFIPGRMINIIVGSLFIALGAWGFVKMRLKRKEKKPIVRASPFLTSFLTLFAIEFGDKTQIASGLLAAEYQVPLPIFFGILIGLAFTIGLNVFVGTKIARKLPRKALRIATSVLFILFGLFTLIF